MQHIAEIDARHRCITTVDYADAMLKRRKIQRPKQSRQDSMDDGTNQGPIDKSKDLVKIDYLSESWFSDESRGDENCGVADSRRGRAFLEVIDLSGCVQEADTRQPRAETATWLQTMEPSPIPDCN